VRNLSAQTIDTSYARTGRGPAARPSELTCELVGSVEGIRALDADYEQLYRVTRNALPFARQEWHLAWCAHFLNRSPQIREEPLFCVLRDGSGECVGLVPLILCRRRVGPLNVVTLAVLGADPGLTEIRNPLVKPGCERAVVRAVHRRLAEVPDWHWIDWCGVSGALAEALKHEAAPRWYGMSQDFVLDLPSGWQEFRAGLKRNVRESLRHCYNSLRRESHAFEFVVTRRRSEVRPALDRFLELHTLRANMAWGPKHPDRFVGGSLRAFLYDVCERLAARDALRVFQLTIGGRIVASRIAFVVGDSVYLYYSGFDPLWARYSVMTTTLAEAFRYAIASGLKSVNLSPTREQSKMRWRPRRLDFHSALVHRESLRSRLVCAAYRAALAKPGVPVRLLKTLFWAPRDWS
jgi:CelD/BcsL family acetyltransferase involved in cellulose biosynthesis